MTLKIPRSLIKQVFSDSEKAYPEESCGLLIAELPGDFGRPGRTLAVLEARAATNQFDASARGRRYQIDPRLFAKVESELSGSGRAIAGFYHSHPDVPAWPSPFDLEAAWPGYSYWIVSVRSGKACDSRSWVRSEDGRGFIEEAVVEEG